MQNATLEGYRLSPQQRRVWGLLGGAPSSRPHAQCAVSVSGHVTAGALRRAVERLVSRHEVLRTEFQRLPGMEFPIQVIGEGTPVRWREVDLRGVVEGGEQGRRQALAGLMKLERAAGVEAEPEAGGVAEEEAGGVVRACLAVFDDEERVVVLSVSGMAGDSRSMMNMVRELGECYAAAEGADGAEVVQYADYSEWQNELTEGAGEAAEEARAFWRDVHAGSAQEISLPLESTSKLDEEAESCEVEGRAEPYGAGLEELEVKIDERVAREVAAQAGRFGVTEEVLLLASWQLLLWHLTRQPEIGVATLYDGRKFEGLDKALGPFSKYLSVQTHYQESYTFPDVLRYVNENWSKADEWQEYFSTEAAGRRGEDEAAPSSTLAFEYQQWPAEYSAAGLRFSLLYLSASAEPFSLRLRLSRSVASLRARFYFDLARFSRAAIELLADQFLTLLASACAHPDLAISDLDALGHRERLDLLSQPARQSRPYPTSPLLPALFEAQAAQTPDASAVECGEERLSFAELNAAANRLARLLRGMGAGRGGRVVLLLERSAWQVVGVLAAWKAGAAYVPV
ncbi:MAG: condensation domain-containing protein, partial [Pyrinomonadaceae bacterium]